VPRIAITLGSGLGDLVDAVEEPVSVPFADVRPIPAAGVAGHGGRFVFGVLEGVDVVLQAGRVHHYEGYDPEVVSAPVRILAVLGVEAMIFTNASGGIRADLRPGDLLLIEDQINASFTSPLAGPMRPGEPRFPDMSGPFDAGLREAFKRAAISEGLELPEGTYASVHGPSYETRAEVRMLARLGADVVGMSTTSEVIVARSLGLRVAAVSLVTNRATGLSTESLSHADVLRTGRAAAERAERLIRAAVARFDVEQTPRGQSTGAK
jgi:purine-nucleoside phosphorylase